MLSLLRWIWQVPPSKDEWTRFITGFFYRSLLLVLIAMGILLAYIFISDNTDLGRLPTILSLAILNLVCLSLVKMGQLRYALHLFIWLGWLALAISSFTSIGVYTPAYLTVSILIVIAGLGLSKQTSFIFTSLSVLYGLFLLFGHSQGWI